jgi:PAS domain S-box-containing protein
MPIRELLRTRDLLSDPLALVSVDGTIDTPNHPFADQLDLPVQAMTGRRLDALAAVSAEAI